MTTGQEQVSSLPLPPVQYITQYTDENVRRGRAPKPPPFIQDAYTMFGRTFNADDPIIRPLESQGIKRLYPQNFDRRRELKKLNHSLLVNFLDLIDILVHCPDSPKRAEKVEDISILFIHIHHLVNEFRPHQARETLRVMLELQKRQRMETALRFRKHRLKANLIFKEALSNLPGPRLNMSLIKSVRLLCLNRKIKSQREVGPFDGCSEENRRICDVIDKLLHYRRRKRKR